MTFKTFLASVGVIALILGPVSLSAQEIVDPAATIKVQLQNELDELKLKEADTSIGFMNRFFLRIKIKELENKLNIATALK